MSLKKNILVSYASQLLNTGLSFIGSVFITRLLGASGRGDFSIFTNAQSIFLIWLGLSLPSSIIYFVSSQKINASKMFTTMVVFTIVSTALMTLVLLGLFSYNLQWIVFPQLYQGMFWVVLFLFQFCVSQFNSILNAFLNARKIFIPQLIFNSIMSVVTVLIWVALYFNWIPLKQTGFATVVLVTAFLLVPPLLYNLFLFKVKSGIKFTLEFLSRAELWLMFKFALIAYGCNAIQALTYKMDLWFVDYYYGKAETGVYSLSVTLAQLIWILPNAMSAVLFTYLSSSSRTEAIENTVRYSKIAIYFSLILAFISVILYYNLIPIVYGYDFVNASALILILLCGIVPFSITTIIATFNASINKPIYNLWTTVWGFLFAAIFYAVLIPFLGAIGAAWASVISYNACTIYIMYNFYKYTGQKVWNITPEKKDIAYIKMFINRLIKASN